MKNKLNTIKITQKQKYQMQIRFWNRVFLNKIYIGLKI